MHHITENDKTTRTRYLSIDASPFVTVASVLAFADKLRERDMPAGARIVADHSHQTQHLTGLSVSVSEDLTPGSDRTRSPS